jgi:hypothetical protein
MRKKGVDPNSIDVSVVERILAVVGEKFIPSDLDKQKLAIGLASCLTTYSSAVRRRSDKPTKDRIRRLNSIRKAAKRLELQLQPDDVWDWSDRYWECDYLQENVKDLIKRIDSDLGDLAFELEWGPDFDEAMRLRLDPRDFAGRWRAHSPFEWVAGHYLPNLFRTHFGIKPAFHRRNDVPDSPAIRFIEKALTELGITNARRPYSRESIAKALTDLRTGRARKNARNPANSSD